MPTWQSVLPYKFQFICRTTASGGNVGYGGMSQSRVGRRPLPTKEKPAAIEAAGFPFGLERREVEKRIYEVKGSGSRLPPPFMSIL